MRGEPVGEFVLTSMRYDDVGMCILCLRFEGLCHLGEWRNSYGGCCV